MKLFELAILKAMGGGSGDTSVYKFKGTVSDISSITEREVGDVYNVNCKGTSYYKVSNLSIDCEILYETGIGGPYLIIRDTSTGIDFSPGDKVFFELDSMYQQVAYIAKHDVGDSYLITNNDSDLGDTEGYILDSYGLGSYTISGVKFKLDLQAGDNIAWTGYKWDKLAGTVDMSNYYTKEQIDTLLSSAIIPNASGVSF